MCIHTHTPLCRSPPLNCTWFSDKSHTHTATLLSQEESHKSALWIPGEAKSGHVTIPKPFRGSGEVDVDPLGLGEPFLGLRASESQGVAKNSQAGPNQVLILVLRLKCCAAPDKPPTLSIFPAIKQRGLDELTPKGRPDPLPSCSQLMPSAENEGARKGCCSQRGQASPMTKASDEPRKASGNGDAVGARALGT